MSIICSWKLQQAQITLIFKKQRNNIQWEFYNTSCLKMYDNKMIYQK